jgi:hypothetical protein
LYLEGEIRNRGSTLLVGQDVTNTDTSMRGDSSTIVWGTTSGGLFTWGVGTTTSSLSEPNTASGWNKVSLYIDNEMIIMYQHEGEEKYRILRGISTEHFWTNVANNNNTVRVGLWDLATSGEYRNFKVGYSNVWDPTGSVEETHAITLKLGHTPRHQITDYYVGIFPEDGVELVEFQNNITDNNIYNTGVLEVIDWDTAGTTEKTYTKVGVPAGPQVIYFVAKNMYDSYSFTKTTYEPGPQTATVTLKFIEESAYNLIIIKKIHLYDIYNNIIDYTVSITGDWGDQAPLVDIFPKLYETSSDLYWIVDYVVDSVAGNSNENAVGATTYFNLGNEIVLTPVDANIVVNRVVIDYHNSRYSPTFDITYQSETVRMNRILQNDTQYNAPIVLTRYFRYNPENPAPIPRSFSDSSLPTTFTFENDILTSTTRGHALFTERFTLPLYVECMMAAGDYGDTTIMLTSSTSSQNQATTDPYNTGNQNVFWGTGRNSSTYTLSINGSRVNNTPVDPFRVPGEYVKFSMFIDHEKIIMYQNDIMKYTYLETNSTFWDTISDDKVSVGVYTNGGGGLFKDFKTSSVDQSALKESGDVIIKMKSYGLLLHLRYITLTDTNNNILSYNIDTVGFRDPEFDSSANANLTTSLQNTSTGCYWQNQLGSNFYSPSNYMVGSYFRLYLDNPLAQISKVQFITYQGWRSEDIEVTIDSVTKISNRPGGSGTGVQSLSFP